MLKSPSRSLLPWSTAVLLTVAQSCGAQPNLCGPVVYPYHYGPYDYRSDRAKLQVVEDFHFTPVIEAGIRGKNGDIGGDINYTLKASPNHHRALTTLSRLTATTQKDQMPGMEWPMECYFDRAIRFRADDPVVRMLYAQFLVRKRRPDEADRQLITAIGLATDNPFTQYNAGLIYLEMGNIDKARAQAHKAAALGFPRQELADQLKKLGQWREASAVDGTASPTLAAPAASAASEPARP